MIQRANSIAIAAYLLLCILLGGSAQNSWTNLALQLLGIAIIAWAAVAPRDLIRTGLASAVDGLLLAALAVLLVQLVPLPPDVWSQLPGRDPIARGFETLGYPLPAMPISETPYRSVLTLFALIPAIAAFVAMGRLAPSSRAVAASIVIGTILGILLGALQVAGGTSSWAYLYKFTNSGAVGFFANQNHMATLLLVSIPMGAALLASAKSGRKTSSAGRYAIGIALLLLVVIGVLLNRSLAALALVLPVLIASATIIPAAAKWRVVALPLTGIALIAGMALVATNPISSRALQADASTSLTSRGEMWSRTSEAIADSFPVGTGLGSFEQVYRQYERPQHVNLEYVNHAHNDYLELVLELGIAGLALILFFLVWWSVAAVRVWTSPLSTPFARAATIATAAVLVQSAVDYPLRTAAIAAIFGALTGAMVRQPEEPKSRERERQATRHVSLG